jgi:hypothetical protein
MMSRVRRYRAIPSAFAALLFASTWFVACSGGMEAKECDKLRGEAFDLLNKAQHCNSDADCRQSEWPGCAKPLSRATFDKIGPMRESFQKGKCVEPKLECKEPPPAYCKQGLCVHREKGTPEGAGNTPTDQIKVE